MEILTDLNPEQAKAVQFGEGPLLILAGAGSGKTRVLTHRVAYLVKSLVSFIKNYEVSVQTHPFPVLPHSSRTPAEEMLGRVRRLLGSDVFITGGTFHGWCARTMRKYGERVGLDRNFVIFDEGDQLDTVKQAMGLLGVDIKSVKPGAILGAISGAKNELVSPKDYGGYARGNFQLTVARVYVVYQQLLRRYKAVDFDDLLGGAVGLLTTQPDVLEELQERFKYILVDEYQDTNKAQYEITKLLAKKHRNLTVVGDAAQAIYSWRGADYRNLLLLKQDFPDLTTINLEQNYRSTQNILSAANQVIAKNKNHPILNLWTDRGNGEKIVLFEAESELAEARFVAEEIAGQIRRGELNLAEMAVLYRTNAQSRVLEEAFLHGGIPYSLVGGVRFYERKEIKDILAYLRLILNPEDEISRKRAEKNGKNKLKNLENEFGKGETKETTLDLLDKILKVTAYLEQFNEEDEEDTARLENIKELRSVATQYTQLADFLENIALTEKEAKTRFKRISQGEGGAVTLMTLHAAKGLEFKEVFMVGMEEGLFPHSRALSDPEQMEEERRLCYVGMTRAMDRLYLTYAVRRLYFGQRSNNMVSRFLGDIPEKFIQSSRKESLSQLTWVKKMGKMQEENWGFDENGEWKWKPED
ncbi:MAG: exodeoxyribonuclease V subunit gamma [Firmicutes bacterium]|nr:exodeoxyribonuclease V subunit gamma [Bacillota bacterium]